MLDADIPELSDLRRAHYVLKNEADTARMTRGHNLGVESGPIGEALQRVATWLAKVIMEKQSGRPGHRKANAVAHALV